jgi:transposase-like protein
LLSTCVDGLKGFPEAVSASYPKAKIQLCIIHLAGHSLKFIPWKDYKELTRDLKLIYQSATEDEVKLELQRFAEKWPKKYPQIGKSWF